MNRLSALVGVAVMLALAALTFDTLAAEPASASRKTKSSRTVALVTSFFEALESHRYPKACSLLGSSLVAETGGPACPSLLESGMPDPLRWRILGTRATRDGIGVIVRLGQNELDHVRMRTWLAIVRQQGGAPKIVETRLLL